MSVMSKDEKTIIEKDIHCPYCKKEKAILINKEVSRKWSLQLSAYGLRFIFSVIYLSIIHIIRYGMKILEVVRKSDILTYCFCPECGNSYSLNPPKEISDEVADTKLYRVEQGKLLRGVCKGISVLTEIPLLWIRIVSVFYGLEIVISIKRVLQYYTYSWFSPESLTSNWYKYFYPVVLYIVGIISLFLLYYLFSAMLKIKKIEQD